MSSAKRNVAVLAVCQALLMTGTSILITLGGLVGYALADDKSLATLPVSTVMIGTMLATIPASLWMRRVGRRAGFLLGGALGIVGAAICSYALYEASFWLFCFGTVFLGMYNAFAQYYRFAAADVAEPEFKSRAISLVLAGGIVAAFLGPASTRWTKDLLEPITFLGSYLSIIVITALALLLLSTLDIPKLTDEQKKDKGRPLGEILMQPAVFVAMVGTMIGYGVMSLVMTATPLAMVAHGHPFDDATTVIQWHIVGMFGPAFFTGHLIARFGVLKIMMIGAVSMLLCISLTVAGEEFINFWSGLVLLGVGWNFLFVGGTSLLTECYTPSEKAKVEATNTFLVFGTVAMASVGSGTLLHLFDWQTVNIGALPFVLFAGLSVIWLAWVRRREVEPAV
jgi:MFS family permease